MSQADELTIKLKAAQAENARLREVLHDAEHALRLFVGANNTHTEMERIVAATTALVGVQAALRR